MSSACVRVIAAQDARAHQFAENNKNSKKLCFYFIFSQKLGCFGVFLQCGVIVQPVTRRRSEPKSDAS